MAIAVIVLAVVLVVASAVLLLRGGNPEATATHIDEAPPDTESQQLYGGADRPAGPDVEGGPGDGIRFGS